MQQTLIDTLLERPVCFATSTEGKRYGVHRFALCQPPLGVVLLTAPILEALGFDSRIAHKDIALEALRLSTERRSLVLRLVAIYTLRGQSQWLDDSHISERIKALEVLTSDELAKLLITILSLDTSEVLMSYYGITEEATMRQRIAKLKDTNTSGVSLGGRTIYGSLIDEIAQRYGWTLHYILWEISYSSLKMLMADATAHYPLTQDEMAQLGISSANIIRMDEKIDDDAIAHLLQD